VKSALLLLLLLAGCDALGGNDGGGSGARVTESGTKRGSAGGFSAQLSAELAKQNVEPANIASAPPAPKTAPSAGSAAPTAPTKAGSAAPADTTPPPADTKTPPPADTKTPPPADTKAAPADTKTQPADTKALPTTPVKGLASRTQMKPNAEQAQIKFDLEPNWERDVGEAGTFSLVVKVPTSGEEKVFYARYGLEDQNAPPDCDSYKKFLEDKKLLTVTLNRQRGAACYVEGTDGSGVAMYRYLVTYGGKRLLCTGSLYKDQAALGDLRDKVLMQAKKICETLAL
jgi:hypothetical protein